MEGALFEIFAGEIYKDCFQIVFEKPVRKVTDKEKDALNHCVRVYGESYRTVANAFAKHVSELQRKQQQQNQGP